MGTRRKRPLSVYLDPESPLAKHLENFKDKNGEIVRLAERRLLDEKGAHFEQAVNVTESPVNVTPLPSPITPVNPVNVTRAKPEPEDPGWDE